MGTFTDPLNYTGASVNVVAPDYFAAVGKHWVQRGLNVMRTDPAGYVGAAWLFDPCGAAADPTPDVLTSFLGQAQVDIDIANGLDSSIGWTATLFTVADSGGDAVNVTLQYNYGGSGTGQACRLVLSVGSDRGTSPDFTMTSGTPVTVKFVIDDTNVTVYRDGTQVIQWAYCGSTLGWGKAGISAHIPEGFSAALDDDTFLHPYQGFKFNNFSWTYDTVGAPVDGCGDESISPTTATVVVGHTQHFTSNKSSNWGVSGNSGNNSGGSDTTGGGQTGANGSIVPDAGLPNADTGATYTAPLTPGTYTVNAVNAADNTDHAAATVTVTEPDPVPVRVVDMPALAAGFHAFLFDALGHRKQLPTSRLTSASWTDERYGGWTQFQVVVPLNLGEAAPAAQGDIFEFWWNSQRRYRGFVSEIIVEELDPAKMTLNGYGIAFQAGKPVIDQALVYQSATDVARVFADICRKFVSPVIANLIINAQPVGVLIQQIESTYKKVAAVIQDLCENQAENMALWGGDTDDDGNDRLYVKPFSTVADWSILIPGPNVNVASSDEQGGDIVNRLTILGGNPRYPNLIYNSSFERPRFNGDGEGNILANPDFELATDWSGSGGYETAGPPGPIGGAAYTGTRMWQTEQTGRNGSQGQNPPVIPIVPGWDYVFGANARLQTATGAAAGLVTLVWKDSGGSTLQTDTLAVPAAGSGGLCLSTLWQTFQGVSRAPAGATGYTFEVKVASGGATNNGIVWDACELAPATIVYQDKWEMDLNGSATINRLNWAFADGIDGGYCVLADISAADDDADEAAIQPIAAERFEVQAGATYNVSVFLKSPSGVTTNEKLRLEVQEFDKDGHETTITHVNIAAGSGWADWTQETGAVTTQLTTTHCMVRFVWRGSSAILIDGLCFRDSSAGTDFIRDGQFTTRIQVTDGRLTGISSDAADSISNYGPQEAIITVDDIATIDDAIVYATAYFNIHAVPVSLPTVTLINDDRFFRPGDLVQFIGKDAVKVSQGATQLPIVLINWSWDGLLHAELQLQKEQPTLASLIKSKIATSGGGGSAYTATSGSTPSPIVGGGGVSITATGPIAVTPTPIVGAGVISHEDSSVVPGDYGPSRVTVDGKGHLTAAHEMSLLTDGDLDDPQLIFGDGDVIWVTL